MPALIGVIFLWVHVGDLCCVISQALPILERCYFRFFFSLRLSELHINPSGALVSWSSIEPLWILTKQLTVIPWSWQLLAIASSSKAVSISILPEWPSQRHSCVLCMSLCKSLCVYLRICFWGWWLLGFGKSSDDDIFVLFQMFWKSIYLKEYLEGICIQYFSAAFRVVRPT